MTQESAVVIGAGPGGLACADELLRHGIRPIVLEKAGMPGGLARTEVYKGYHFDIGGHRFYTKMRGINELWHEMLGADFLKVDRLSRIYFNGRFFNYPLTPFSTLSNLGILEACRILVSYAKSQAFPYRNEETFEQWVSNRFGQRLYESFFKNYTEKVWGISCTELSADWAAQRIKGLSLVAAVSNALLGQTKAKSLIDQFEYPVQGPGLLWKRFVESIEARGGEIRFNTDVSGIRVEDGKAASVRYRVEGEEREIQADRIISSMPLSALITGLDPVPPPEVLDAAGRLTYRAFLTVGLIVDPTRPVQGPVGLCAQSRGQGRPHPEFQELEQGHVRGPDEDERRVGVLLHRGR